MKKDLSSVVRKSPAVKSKRTGNTGILLNLVTGNYFEVDEIGFLIWKMIDGKTGTDHLVSRLVAIYDAPPSEIEKDTSRFIAELRKRKLIEVVNP
jgi:hypothetical protein